MCFVAPEQKLFYGQFLLPDSEERLGTLIKIRTDISSHTHKPVNLLLSPLLLVPLFNPPPLIHWSKRNLSWIMIHSTDYSYWLITTLTLLGLEIGIYLIGRHDLQLQMLEIFHLAFPLVIHGELNQTIPLTTPSSSRGDEWSIKIFNWSQNFTFAGFARKI